MGQRLSFSRILKIIKKEDAETITDLLVKCGFTLKRLDDGVFREVFEIVGSDVVVKVPKDGDGLCHASDEAKGWKIVHTSKHPAAVEARRHIPSRFAYDKPSGFIFMPKYQVSKAHKYDNEMNRLNKLFRQVICNGKKADIDLGASKYDNYGLDKHGKLVILDMGCFTEDWWKS
jgi:hypothetical protein